MKYFLLSIICFLSPVLNASDNNPANYTFAKINGDAGLSQNGVKTIIQDSDGFMWFGTRNKLNRYDGTNIKIFDCTDPALKLSNNNISSLHEDNDKNLWVGTDKGVFLFNPLKETFSFFNKIADDGTDINDWVADIVADHDNNIWIVVPNQGLFRYNNTTSRNLYHYHVGDTLLPYKGNPECIAIERNGRVWIGTNGSGVYLYDKEKNTFVRYLGDKNGNSLEGKNIYTMCDYGDDLIIGVHEGKLEKLNKKRNILQEVKAPEVYYKIIRDVTCFGNELWVGTLDGVYIINEPENTVVNIKHDPVDSESLSDNMIEDIYRDREGGIWIGTIYGGVNYLLPKSIRFERFVPQSHHNSISSKRISCLQEDADGNIWIGSENADIDIYNPQNGEFRHLKTEINTSSHHDRIITLFFDGDKILAGYFKKGLDVISLNSMQIKHYSAEQLGLNEPSVFAIYKDRFDRIWIGNGWGVFIADNITDKFTPQPQTGFIYDIVEDSEGYVWIASIGNGVYKHNLETNETVHYLHNREDSTSLSSNSVSSIFVDSAGKVWLSTDRGGICCYNKDKDNFTSYSVKDGLPDDVSYKILEDKQHNLWFGTNNGLVKFNPQTKEVRVFKKNHGLPGNQFLYRSALISSSGKFYFGGVDGLVAFDPFQYKENTFIPPVFITKLTVLNKEVKTGSPDSPLKQSIVHTRNIVLKHDQSNMEFEFVALSYAASKANLYAYKMENIDEDWIYCNNRQSVSYAKLLPGKYRFRVKASNNDGLWNEDGTYIDIEILPPWWQSGIAYFIYVIIFIACISSWFFWYNKKQKRQQFERQKLFETEKEKELYSAKVDFFTNIAHEIKTPLTLINGPLESLLEMDIKDPEVKKNLLIMEKNTSELLILINQLLDFKKVDAHKFILTFTMTNLSGLIRNVYARFESSVVQKKKIIKLILPDTEFYVPVDKEAIVKILNNLLSNAISYSFQNIEIELKKYDNNNCSIRFSNDGELIPKEERERIFDPFYQLDRNKNNNSSSGIGLSLARSLSQLHNGSLYLADDPDMNTFILRLPLIQDRIEKELPENDIILEESEITNKKQSSETILIVEDNIELLSFIIDKLKDLYEVTGVTDGEEALSKLNDMRADLLISDIMMTGMDGYELCRTIKSDIEHSHIPIILLTAKHDLQSKIKGLEAGADAYIEKPFSVNYLISQISTLLTNRKREKEAFMQKPFLAVQQMGITKADEQFLNLLIDKINEYITDKNFSVETLADLIYTSRSSLHRKIKALSGLTPVDFIRLIRLKRAATLLIENEHSISEISYLVGIHSSSYFTKIFQKQFGMTPKEFRNKNSK
jgi:ligand-binding sensor domain-containing protein/DNA-binding response OmpR family regulator/nitrogen-specific signal transduction histidine kinase